jgi:hypothetical protein
LRGRVSPGGHIAAPDDSDRRVLISIHRCAPRRIACHAELGRSCLTGSPLYPRSTKSTPLCCRRSRCGLPATPFRGSRDRTKSPPTVSAPTSPLFARWLQNSNNALHRLVKGKFFAWISSEPPSDNAIPTRPKDVWRPLNRESLRSSSP